jgi:nitroreductase
MDDSRLSMPLGEAIFTQRSIRRFKSDPIAVEDLHLILEAAVKAPNGGNQQLARFLVVTDRDAIREFGVLYHEAWWAKRHDEGFHNRSELPRRFHPAAGLADAMLAARALGIGSVPTTLHQSVMPRFHTMFDIPSDVSFHFCVPLGYPAGNFGPNVRKPTSETSFLNRWGADVPWD